MSESDDLTVAYVMSRFPKLTETFILAELEAMDRAGVRIELFPLLRQTGEPVQPAAVRWVERAHYLPFLSLPILRASGVPPRSAAGGGATSGRSSTCSAGTWRSPNFFLGGLGIFPKVAHMAIVDARPRGRPRPLPLREPPGARRLAHPSAGRDPVQLHRARLRPPRRQDDAADEGRRGGLRRDDLTRQPKRDRGDGGPSAQPKVDGHPLRRRSGGVRAGRSARPTGHCGSWRSGRCTRSRARSI